MSSSNNIIWIFVSFVGLIAIVSGNRLNFFDGYQFSHLKIFVSALIRTAFFDHFYSLDESLKFLFKNLQQKEGQ